tara:strand:- start:640 stop:1341 length:702 start_codon:yes stop_codon:yes gene_type:complete
MRNFLVSIFFISLFFSCQSEYKIEPSFSSYLDINAPPDSISLNIINPYKKSIDSVMKEILCFNKTEMEKGKPESLLGNFVADLCIYETNSYDMVDFCLLNNGGLRSSLDHGDITRGDIYKLMPFDNKMVIVKVFKEDILEIFKYIQNKGGDPISKLRIEIKNEEVINHNLNLKKDTFYVLTTDYLASGGDDMSFFIDKEVNNLNLMLRDLIIEHCNDKDSITSSLDNRIFIHE